MATEFVRGDDLSRLTVPLDGPGWADLDLAGATVRLEAASRDVTTPLMLNGMVNATDRTATFVGLGALLSVAELAPKNQARYTARAHLTTAEGPQGFGEPQDITIVENPLEGVVDTSPGSLHPFEFPYPTGADKILTPPPVILLNFSNGTRQVVFSQPPGTSGIVRNLSWITSAVLADGVTATVGDLTLEVKYDGEATPSISIPLFTLAGMEFPRSCLKDVRVSTPAFELSAGIFTELFPGIPVGSAGNWRLPLPYSNGIEIAVVAPATTDKQSIFFNTIYQDRLPPCWNSNLRLQADRVAETLAAATGTGSARLKLTDSTHLLAIGGTFPSNIVGRCIIADEICTSDMLVLERTDSTHVVVSARDTLNASLNVETAQGNGIHVPVHTFLNRLAGEAGWLAMVVGGQKSGPTGSPDLLFEANPRIFLNQSAEADLQWTSVEDFANGCFYFEQPSNGEEGGIVSHDNVTNYESSVYKVFYRHPIRYTNGVRMTVPQYDPFAASTYRWTAFYYREIA